jgi:hypothetical protein
MIRLHGYDAIEYASENDRLLNKYSDPTEGERIDLTVEKAKEVAQEDCDLIWIETDIALPPTQYREANMNYTLVGYDAEDRIVLENENGDWAAFTTEDPNFDYERITAWYHPTGYKTHWGEVS